MAIDVSAREVLRLRLRTQRIECSTHTGVADTVRHLLAIQAQDFAQSLWAVGVRTPGATRSDVLAALESGVVVRTLPMRGTLHLIPAEDLRWMLAVTSARMLQSASTRFRDLGLDQATLDRAEKLVARELDGGGSATRDEFMKLLERNGISAEGQRGYHVIFFLSQRQLICWGPPRGTQQALVLVDEWIPNYRELDRDESLREFALRYFAGHGPATVRDFAWWTKLTLADARAGIAAASDDLTELTLNGASYWIATTELDAAAASTGTPAVHALPGFDEYLLGYQDRSLALADEHSDRIVPGKNGIFLPLIVARGEVIGTWRRAQKSTAIIPEHFATASKAQHAGFEHAAKAYARFAEG
jgi:Winged helix DNA-binding domain